jgi:hypothetical protein
VVYTSQQAQGSYADRMDLPILLDPALLRAARQIYRTYYEVHPELTQRPYGVAIIMSEGMNLLGCRAMGDALIRALERS